jgi:hypothetical protein
VQELITQSLCETHLARCLTYVDAFALSRTDLWAVLDQFPESKWKVRKAGTFLAMRVAMVNELRSARAEKALEDGRVADSRKSIMSTMGSQPTMSHKRLPQLDQRRSSIVDTPCIAPHVRTNTRRGSHTNITNIGGGDGGSGSADGDGGGWNESANDSERVKARLDALGAAVHSRLDNFEKRMDESRAETRRMRASVRALHEGMAVLLSGGSGGVGFGVHTKDNSKLCADQTGGDGASGPVISNGACVRPSYERARADTHTHDHRAHPHNHPRNEHTANHTTPPAMVLSSYACHPGAGAVVVSGVRSMRDFAPAAAARPRSVAAVRRCTPSDSHSHSRPTWTPLTVGWAVYVA